MADPSYFLVNDTRYDNHHGGLTVIRNLHRGMAARGWTCTGSLPVSAKPSQLGRFRERIDAASMVIVNGEGSLHHNSRNARRLLGLCRELQATRPVAIINTTWQDNDSVSWKPVLDRCTTISVRDRRSQERLAGIGVDADYAPDLTFYDYPIFPRTENGRYVCTDSVFTSWTEWALDQSKNDPDMDFITLFTRHLHHTRGMRDGLKRLKYTLLPSLSNQLPDAVPPRYKALCHSTDDTPELIAQIASARAICTGRYHALCFALQQNTPFIAVPSNSGKIEALLMDVGLPRNIYLLYKRDHASLHNGLERAIDRHPTVEATIKAFNDSARQKIDDMFDSITSNPQG